MICKKDLFNLFIIVILAFILTSGLFVSAGRPITFDGHVHATTIAQFYKALVSGDFPVRWTAGFANYGFPLGVFAQQLPAYIGAGLMFIFHNVVFSYNLTFLLFSISSALLFYIFLRLYYNSKLSLLGVTIFNFAPYRILNIYLRGALPEFASSTFIILGLIGIYYIFNIKKYFGQLIFPLAVVGILLTHPMTMVIAMPVWSGYFLYNFLRINQKVKITLNFAILTFIGLLLSAYYILPLLMEIKYMVYASQPSHYSPDSFLNLASFIDFKWGYWGTHPGIRNNLMRVGIIETILVAISFLSFVYQILNKKYNWKLIWWQISLILTLFLLLPISNFLYKNISLLNGIQHPWRMLGALIIIIPIIFIEIISKLKYSNKFAYMFIILILILRTPQIYAKNFMNYSDSYYFFTKANLHTVNMNTVWTGDVRKYPIEKQKVGIIKGNPTIKNLVIKNSKHSFAYEASQSARMVDYTFYFPGWKVYVDKNPVAVQFQDPNYRGVITYQIPKGNHYVEVVFENTKIRKIANYLSILGVLILIGWLFACNFYKYAKK